MILHPTYKSITRYFFFALMVAFLGGLQACNEDLFVEPIVYGTVRGQVFYNTSRLPVAKALVRLSPTSRSVETDSLGNFRFDSLDAGSYSVIVTAPGSGYATQTATVQITDERIQVMSIYLRDDRGSNKAPNPPTKPSPASGAINVPTTVVLRWDATDPDRRDSLSYDVQFFREGDISPTTIGLNLRRDTLVVPNLQYNTTYYWQVIVKDGLTSTKGDVWSFRTVTFPDFSYVFARRTDGRLQLFASNATSETQQLTQTGSNWRPIVSPNREQIAFISNAETETHLYVMNRDGSRMRRVTNVPVAGISPTDLSFCWSPDGTQLLYPSNDRLYAVRTDGTGLRLVGQAPAGRFFAGCDWTAQGNRIVARTTGANVYDNELVLLAPDGTNPTVSTSLFKKPGRMSNPVFSVDGKQVLFSLDLSDFQNEQGRQLNAHLQLLTIATGAVVDLSTTKRDGTNDLEPRFSPNGASVIFTNADNTVVVTGIGQRDIYTQSLTGSGSGSNNFDRKILIAQGEMPAWR
ncbi:MAG: carboxypeptidase regulatory-like domain-containing protein [Cytophagaceae bacterium]|nr:carboxypeptidase regulatory-like domain-containing protein [Cytophagaceae bacterium]